MTDQPTDWLKEQPAATLILAAYADREAQLPKRSPRRAEITEAPVTPAAEAEAPVEPEPAANDEENADAWIPRISSVDGVDPTVLSQLHGGLIARGFLKYELFGRQIGMRYRLTPDGRRAAEAAELLAIEPAVSEMTATEEAASEPATAEEAIALEAAA